MNYNTKTIEDIVGFCCLNFPHLSINSEVRVNDKSERKSAQS